MPGRYPPVRVGSCGGRVARIDEVISFRICWFALRDHDLGQLGKKIVVRYYCGR